jgi:hypothetical protein
MYFVFVTHHEAHDLVGRCPADHRPGNLGFLFVSQFYPSLRDKARSNLLRFQLATNHASGPAHKGPDFLV